MSQDAVMANKGLTKRSSLGSGEATEIGDPNSSSTADLLKNTTHKCEVCGGKGHEYFECPTKKRLDAIAKNNGDRLNWGAWKYHTYYKSFTKEQRAAHSKLGKRKYGQKGSATSQSSGLSVSVAGTAPYKRSKPG